MDHFHGKSSSEKGLLNDILSEYKCDPEFVAEELALRIAEDAARIMHQKGLNRSQLARQMGPVEPLEDGYEYLDHDVGAVDQLPRLVGNRYCAGLVHKAKQGQAVGEHHGHVAVALQPSTEGP